MSVFQWLGIAMKWGPHVISAVYLPELTAFLNKTER